MHTKPNIFRMSEEFSTQVVRINSGIITYVSALWGIKEDVDN